MYGLLRYSYLLVSIHFGAYRIHSSTPGTVLPRSLARADRRATTARRRPRARGHGSGGRGAGSAPRVRRSPPRSPSRRARRCETNADPCTFEPFFRRPGVDQLDGRRCSLKTANCNRRSLRSAYHPPLQLLLYLQLHLLLHLHLHLNRYSTVLSRWSAGYRVHSQLAAHCRAAHLRFDRLPAERRAYP